MRRRSAYIDIVHQVALAGMEYGITEKLGLPAPEKYHDKLIYPALIQAGIHTFKIEVSEYKRPSSFEQLDNEGRIEVLKDLQLAVRAKKIEEDLKGALLVEAKPAIKSKLFILAWFISELSVALEERCALVSTIGMPRIEDFYGILPLNILMPVKLLLDCISSIETSSPIPQRTVLKSDTQHFLEIIESTQFCDYSVSHTQLEHSQAANEKAIRKISTAAQKLKEKFNHRLDIQKMTISLLPITAKIIDAVAEKLPGVMANILSESLSDYLKDQKSILIYDYGTIHYKVLMGHYLALKNQ